MAIPVTTLASGHRVERLSEEARERRGSCITGHLRELVRLEPGGWCLPPLFLPIADRIYDFKFRASDVVLMTFPKCGTTWLQEVLWTMRNNPQLDHNLTLSSLMLRSPFIEFDMILGSKLSKMDSMDPLMQRFHQLCPGKDPAAGMILQMAQAIPDPRTIKTHLAFSLHNPDLLNTAKVVYVARNPLDVVISYHHHHHIFPGHNYQGTFDQFVDLFVDDLLIYGNYGKHLNEAWQRRNHPNLHFIFYEDMISDYRGEIVKLDAFLGTELSERQIQNVMEHSSFKQMKKRNVNIDLGHNSKTVINEEGVNVETGFFRQGQAGSWRNKFTPEQTKKMKQWVAQNMPHVPFNFMDV